MVSTITFPNFSAGWPFPRSLNPHHSSASQDSADWVESFHVLNDRKTQNTFNRCNFSLLACLVYAHADPAHLRLACDLVNWFFVFDQVSDDLNGAEARDLGVRLINILRDPLKYRSMDLTSLESMTASFWARCLEIACPTSAKRFVETMESYIEGVWQEAEDRVSGRVRSIDEYLALRRETSGIKPAFDFLLLTTEISEKALADPRVANLTRAGVDLMIMLNDVYSWNYERARGLDEHNLVTVVIAEKGLDEQSAIDYVGDWYRDIANNFVEEMKNIDFDPVVSEYVFGLGNAVTGYREWAFESERYFGCRGHEVRESRVVELLPKISPQRSE